MKVKLSWISDHQWPACFWRSCPECRARSCARSLSFYSTDLGQCRRREHALWQYWRWPMFQQAGGHVDHPRQAVAAFGVVCCISTWGACNLSGSICIAALSQVCKYVWSVNGLQVFSFLEFHVRGWGYYTYMSHMYYVFGSLMRIQILAWTCVRKLLWPFCIPGVCPSGVISTSLDLALLGGLGSSLI